MYAFAAGSARWKFQQAWVAGALVVAAIGMFMSTTGGPVFAFVAVCFAAIGFKSASSLFWPIPQGYLDARIAAAVIALINSVGNPGALLPHHLRPAGAADRLDPGWAVWPGRDLGAGGHCHLLRTHSPKGRPFR